MSKKETAYTIRELKHGNDALYKKIYTENRSFFFKYANRYNVPDEDLKDIYQDAFIIFFNKIKRGEILELKSTISTYIIGIGRNKILERYRTDKKESEKTNDYILLKNKTAEPAGNDEDEDKHTQLLYSNLKRLSKKCKEIILSFYYEKLSIEEIKKRGNYASKNVVKSQKSRCIKALREKIENRKG